MPRKSRKMLNEPKAKKTCHIQIQDKGRDSTLRESILWESML